MRCIGVVILPGGLLCFYMYNAIMLNFIIEYSRDGSMSSYHLNSAAATAEPETSGGPEHNTNDFSCISANYKFTSNLHPTEILIRFPDFFLFLERFRTLSTPDLPRKTFTSETKNDSFKEREREREVNTSPSFYNVCADRASRNLTKVAGSLCFCSF